MTTETTQMAHAMAHAWPVWTHHIDPFYVCGDDTFDLLYGRVSGDEYERLQADIFTSLAEHGIETHHIGLETAKEYGCPQGLPMPPLPTDEEIAAWRERVVELRVRLETEGVPK